MEQPQSADDLTREIVTQIAELSKLLGMMSSDDTTVQKAREAHLKLSVLVGKALDIPMP
ncbi:hypothetical protein ACFLVS_02385 [Chloroflexota bacterium]|jgi:hypothetical protein